MNKLNVLRSILGATLAWSVLAAAAGQAQTQREQTTGTRLGPPRMARAPDKQMPDELRGRVTMEQFARCTLDSKPSRVTQALVLDYGEDEEELGNLASSDCLERGTLKLSAQLLRGALYVELYRRYHASISAGKPWNWPGKPLDVHALIDPGAPGPVKEHAALLWLADCVSARNAQAIREVVLNRAGSPKQEEAYAAVIPELSPCIPANQKLALSKAVLDGKLAEYLYRSHAVLAPRPTSAGR